MSRSRLSPQGLRSRWLPFAVALLLAAGCAALLPRPAEPGGEIPLAEPAAARETDPPQAGLPQAGLPEPGAPQAAAAAASPPRPAPPQPLPAAPPAAEELPVPGPLAPIRLKVGLASDLARVTLPCCDGEVSLLMTDGSPFSLVTPITVEPAAAAVQLATYRLQVAALKDEVQARQLAERLGRQSGQPADSHFDAGVDLYRVRVGRWPSRQEAEAARRGLPAGLQESWVVEEGGGLSDPALRVRQGEQGWRVAGRWLTVAAGPGGFVRFANRRYRDRLLVYLNDRGSLNVINELPLEDYLRGVVPREMGPAQYPRLEALKAQAVAARTYTLRNLKEFEGEGYDICATPRCQVYGGAEDEHSLSDRAIAETVQQVLIHGGAPIDALYTSACGGHTEAVRVVFPEKDAPYLAAVPCLEAGVERLASGIAPGSPFPHGLTRALLPAAAGRAGAAAAFTSRLEHLALLAGIPVPADRLGSLDRRELQRFLLSFFDLALDMRLFVSDADLPYLADGTPAGWEEADLRRASYLVKAGLLPAPLDRPLSEGDLEQLLLALAERLQVVRRETARHVRLAGGVLTIGTQGGERALTLPARPLTFRRGGGEARTADLALVPGDRLELFFRGDHLLAIVQEVDPEGVAFDRGSGLASWRRFRSDGELARRVEERYPGLGFSGLEILERGASGRVARLRLLGRDGQSEEVAGLAIRWLLDVPETLFTASRLAPAGGQAGWLITGKGWGHGVGLCQNGAFGMAGRGASYQDILAHYYPGTQLVRVRSR